VTSSHFPACSPRACTSSMSLATEEAGLWIRSDPAWLDPQAAGLGFQAAGPAPAGSEVPQECWIVVALTRMGGDRLVPGGDCEAADEVEQFRGRDRPDSADPAGPAGGSRAPVHLRLCAADGLELSVGQLGRLSSSPGSRLFASAHQSAREMANTSVSPASRYPMRQVQWFSQIRSRTACTGAARSGPLPMSRRAASRVRWNLNSPYCGRTISPCASTQPAGCRETSAGRSR